MFTVKKKTKSEERAGNGQFFKKWDGVKYAVHLLLSKRK